MASGKNLTLGAQHEMAKTAMMGGVPTVRIGAALSDVRHSIREDWQNAHDLNAERVLG